MSAHRFKPGRAGRCERCGCAQTEVIHGRDARTLIDRVNALSDGQRTWVLYWIAQDLDPGPRAVLGAALDQQAEYIAAHPATPESGNRMSAIDDQLADERARLKHIRSLTGDQQAELLVYLARWAGMQIDMWLFDREADATGIRYDAWGKAVRDVNSAH